MKLIQKIIQILCCNYPNIQAIYLFGSFGTEFQTERSDVDIALLFHPTEASEIGQLSMSESREKLEELTGRDVDLINLRLVNTVLQKEVIAADRCLYLKNQYAVDEFEMLTMSKYQKLNEERKEIIQDAVETGRFYRI
jgi:uncharacterized protein